MFYRGDDEGNPSAKGGRLWLKLKEYLLSEPIPTDRSKYLNGDVQDPVKQKFQHTHYPDRRTYYAWDRARQKKLEDQEWDRRLNGVWFMKRGQPMYLTGRNYFYLNYHRYAQNAKPGYRTANAEFYWVAEASINAPNSLGLRVHTRRRDGKTSRAASIGVEGATRIKGFRFGMASKTPDSAQISIFQENVLPAVKALRECPWFMPELRGKIDPANNLRFDTPTTTKRAKNEEEAPSMLQGLGSEILWFESAPNKADSDSLTYFINDEDSKEQPFNAYQRWMTVIPQFMPDGDKIGWGISATTTDRLDDKDEEDEEAGKKKRKDGTSVKMARLFWRASDHTQLESEADFTESRMWRLFIPANKGFKVDEYGDDTDAGLQHFLNIRAKLKGVALINEQRANPLTIEEALQEEANANSLFHVGHLLDNIKAIEAHENETGRPLVRRYRLMWANEAQRLPPVTAYPDENGPWQFSWLPRAEDLNQMMRVGFVEDKAGQRWPKWKPLREDDISLGNDPVMRKKSTLVNQRKASNYSLLVFRPYDEWAERERGQPGYWPSEAFIGRLNFRPENPATCYEEAQKACHLFGTKMYCETQTNAAQQEDFEEHGYEECLAMKAQITQTDTAGQGAPGEAASEPANRRRDGMVQQFIIDYVGGPTTENSRGEVGINDHGVPFDYRRMPFVEVLRDNKEFDEDDRRKSDDTVAEGFALSHAYRRTRNANRMRANAEGGDGRLDVRQFMPGNFFRR